MENDLLQSVTKAYHDRDLKFLESLAKPIARDINKRDDFKSVLMLSCNNIKHLNKINLLEADCIMLNLEDGVSKEDKPFALVLCAIFLTEHVISDKKLVVRVNALDEGGYEEIKYLNKFMPDAIRVPKINNQSEVKQILNILDEKIELHLSIETAPAWNQLSSLAPSKRVTTFYLGILDLFADLRLPQTLINRDNPTMTYMLSHFLITAKSMNIKAVSFVYQEFKNLVEFSKWIELEKLMGYDSKGCISPKQVELANDIFVDDEKELQKAREIVKVFEINQKLGITGFVDEKYGFIDEPIYKGAIVLLKSN
ncbi:MAG: aldolase/citrate lyase family protein [Campylobacterota bacterium]|nr:aldolase/citrate lyase family protein [Campylobacterota bacterium]